MAYKHIVLAALCLAYLRNAQASCSENTNCTSCIVSKSWYGNCRWCPLTNGCHAPWSVYNDCRSSQQVVYADRERCAEVSEPALNYDSHLAEKLAKFSSLAYVMPEDFDKTSIQDRVHELIDPTYQVVEVIFNNHSADFANYSVVIAKSTVNNQIVVAFKGTAGKGKISKQFWSFVLNNMDLFDATGGKVLVYNNQVHSGLYPCVKSIVQELLDVNNSLQVAVTGHSLGGAQAQLAAAALVSEGVVNRSQILVYTFGSPRVGDRDFAYGYDRLIDDSWRVILEGDVIQLIVLFTYHTRREVFYRYDENMTMTPTSNYTICKANECSKLSAFYSTKSHQSYFVKELPWYISQNLTKNITLPSGSRGQCISYLFS